MPFKSSNNSNESGLLIYNKVPKASSTTVASYMLKFGARNDFVHKHVPFGHHFTATKKDELIFLEKHYGYPKKPFSTDQHIMFINAVEDYGMTQQERHNGAKPF